MIPTITQPILVLNKVLFLILLLFSNGLKKENKPLHEHLKFQPLKEGHTILGFLPILKDYTTPYPKKKKINFIMQIKFSFF